MLTTILPRLLAPALALAVGSAAAAVETGTVSIQAIDAKAVEGTTDVALIAIKASRPVTNGLGVSFGLSGTATYGVDYDMPSVAEILPKQTMTVLCIQGLADTVAETGETVVITLTATSDPNYTINTAASRTTVTIAEKTTTTTTTSGGTTSWDTQKTATP